MPEDTSVNTPANTADVEPDNDEIGNEIVIGTYGEGDDAVQYVKQEFKKSKSGTSSVLTGWGFAVPKFVSADQAAAHFDNAIKVQGKEGVTGQQIVLDLLQTALEGKLRIRVKATQPDFKGKDALAQTHYNNLEVQRPDKMLFTIEEAHNWIPGLRELSAKKQFEQKMEQVRAIIAKEGPTSPKAQALLMEIAMSQV